LGEGVDRQDLEAKTNKDCFGNLYLEANLVPVPRMIEFADVQYREYINLAARLAWRVLLMRGMVLLI
jgi:hypothetical protein